MVFIAFIYLSNLGRNPFGFFCDEAIIGLRAQELIRGERAEGTSLFFFDHFGYTSGTLPLYTTAPFVWLFGLNEFAVRLGSAFFMLATLGVLYATFRHLRLSAPWLPVLIFALSPVVIHLSRVNFGHTPSLFCIASGYYLYLLGRSRRSILFSILGGAAIGISAYGYPGFYLATAFFVAALAVTEVVFLRFRWRRARHLTGAIGAAIICYLPILHAAMTNPAFSRRFDDKDVAAYGPFSIDRAESTIQNVQKYYSYDYLFAVGETGLPHAFILRHSVVGAGLLSRTALPFLILGILAFLFVTGGTRKRAFAPFFVLVLLFPLPDLLTTKSDNAPYTFSVFTGVLLVPFVAAYGLEALGAHRDALARDTARRLEVGTNETGTSTPPPGPGRFNPLMMIWTRIISIRFIALAVIIAGVFFVFATYAVYPRISSNYWGWQSGPREMIGYYLEHEDNYDAFFMDGGVGNQPQIFLDFYIDDPTARQKAEIGGVDRIDPSKRQLFGVTRATWEDPANQQTFSAYTILETVTLPDGSDAFYLVERVP